MKIDDGTGHGFQARVDDENLLHTHALAMPYQLHASHDEGVAYTLDLDGVVVDGDGYNFVYIQNTDDNDLIITSINLWVNQNKDDDNVEAWVGHTLADVANHTAIVPANLNPGSGKAASGVFYVNDGAGNLTTLAGGVIAGRFKPTTAFSRWIKETGWVVPKNQTFVLSTAKDNKFTGYISFYIHNSQFK